MGRRDVWAERAEVIRGGPLVCEVLQYLNLAWRHRAFDMGGEDECHLSRPILSAIHECMLSA